MKKCPDCGMLNLNTSHKCECGYIFEDIIVCPFCKAENFHHSRYCQNCHKDIFEYARKERKSKTRFTCTVCNEVFDIITDTEFNAFCCQRCRSIFTYEWENTRLIISIVRKGSIIPEHIKAILRYFNCDLPIRATELHKKYHSLIVQYHPDKVSGMGIEIREVSERKTKEIINNYTILKQWLETTFEGKYLEL
jgi:endogenous inhibitor of DNA gyrase (YacG/DUF329 family)